MATIAELMAKIAYLEKENASLKKENASLKKENEALNEKCYRSRSNCKKWTDECIMVEAENKRLQADLEDLRLSMMTQEQKEAYFLAEKEVEEKNQTSMDEFRDQLDKALLKLGIQP